MTHLFSKKAVTLLLLSSMIASSFASCSNSPVQEGETSAASSSDTVEEVQAEPEEVFDPYTGLPAADYEGHEFNMLIRPNERWISDMYAEEMTGDAITDAIFQRNAAVGDKFNVSIKCIESTDYNYDTSAIAAITAGDDAYDLILAHGRASFDYANQMLLLDWNTALPYIKLDQKWWNQDARNSLSICGKLYVMNGDISYNSLGSANVMLFNKQLATDLGVAYPYDTVLEGKWTFDVWNKQVLSAVLDVNGDGKIVETDDQLGYVTQKWVGPVQAFATSGLRVLDKDENDLPFISFYSEKTVAVFERYFDLIDNDACFVDASDVSYSSGFINVFNEGRALFIDMNMTDVITLRAMEADFGIVPWPKYDEASDYCTNVDAGTNMLIVPLTASDPERTSVILEALCAVSTSTVIPAYYEVTLQGKASRDNDSAGMLDIIKSACIYDLGYYNSSASGTYSNEFVNFIDNTGLGRDIASWYQKNEKVTAKQLEKIVEKYQKED